MVANIIGYKPTSMSRDSEIHEICNFRQHNKWIFISVYLCKSAITVLRTLWATVVWLTTCVNPIFVSSFLNSRRHYNCLVFVCGGPTHLLRASGPPARASAISYHTSPPRSAGRKLKGRQTSFIFNHPSWQLVRAWQWRGWQGASHAMMTNFSGLGAASDRPAEREWQKNWTAPERKQLYFSESGLIR